MKYYLYIFLFNFLILSGSSDDDKPPTIVEKEMMEEPIPKELLLKNIRKENQTIESYFCNSENRTVTYFDENDEVVKIKINYKQVSNSVRIDGINVDTNEVNFHGLYSLNSNYCNIEKHELMSSSGEVSFENFYFYSDNNCSFQRDFIYQTPQEPSKEVVLNDNKKAMNTSVCPSPYAKVFDHNFLARTFYDTDNEVVIDTSYNSIFVYNEDNYPISEVRTFQNGIVENYT